MDNISENLFYSIRILVSNTIGIVLSKARLFCKSLNHLVSTMHTSFLFSVDTTDVQVVTATQIEGTNTTTIQCKFIAGSRATGCMVVLTSENGPEVHYNLTRNQSTNSAAIIVILKYPLSCYDGVRALDIESDGSVGSLAIPGQLISAGSSQNPCTSIEALPGNNAILVIF